MPLKNKSCLKNSKKWGSGAKCHVLAHVRTIRWDNGINKKTKFKRCLYNFIASKLSFFESKVIKQIEYSFKCQFLGLNRKE